MKWNKINESMEYTHINTIATIFCVAKPRLILAMSWPNPTKATAPKPEFFFDDFIFWLIPEVF